MDKCYMRLGCLAACLCVLQYLKAPHNLAVSFKVTDAVKPNGPFWIHWASHRFYVSAANKVALLLSGAAEPVDHES